MKKLIYAAVILPCICVAASRNIYIKNTTSEDINVSIGQIYLLQNPRSVNKLDSFNIPANSISPIYTMTTQENTAYVLTNVTDKNGETLYQDNVKFFTDGNFSDSCGIYLQDATNLPSNVIQISQLDPANKIKGVQCSTKYYYND